MVYTGVGSASRSARGRRVDVAAACRFGADVKKTIMRERSKDQRFVATIEGREQEVLLNVLGAQSAGSLG